MGQEHRRANLPACKSRGALHETQVIDKRPRAPKENSWLSQPTVYVVATILAALAAGAILHYGRIQFGGEDGGIMSDIAYMGKLGYRPYAELRTSGFPPAFVLPAGWAFALLGVRWTSLVAFAALFCAVTLIGQTWLSERAGLGRGIAILLAASTQAATMLPLSAWGYNQVTSVLGALYLTAALGFVLAPKSRTACVALVVTAIGISWGKPNVAGLLLVGTALAFLLSRDTRRSGPTLLVLAAAISCGLLIAFRTDPRAVLASYLVASSRVTPANFITFVWTNDHAEAVQTLTLLSALLFIAFASLIRARPALRWGSRHLATSALAMTGIVTGIVAMGTNNDHNIVDAPVIVIGCVTLCCLAGYWRDSPLRPAIIAGLIASVVGLTALGLISTVTRYRVYSIGPGAYYEDAPLAKVGGPVMMRGVETGPRFRSVVGDVAELLRLNPDLHRLHAPVYFGPRMLVMYPEWGIAPPKGLPTWWGQTPDGDPRTNADISLLRSYQFKLMVFLSGDYTFYPQSLMRVLTSDFDVYQWRSLTIHVRKGATDVTVPPDAVRDQ